MNAPVLAFNQVTLRYPESTTPIATGLDLTVWPGERVGLLGLNGSGKTTLLQAAVGLLPFSGQIQVCGEILHRSRLDSIRSKVGFLFNAPEDQLLFPKVLDDVAFGPRRRGASLEEARNRAMEALIALGAADLAEMEIHQLSHGQKQKVALAGALACRPNLLLLDEPSASLDPPAKAHLAERLREMGTAMLIATHDLVFAASCCERCLLLGRNGLSPCRPDASLDWGMTEAQ